MKLLLNVSVFLIVVLVGIASAEDKLLQQSDFTYLGAFRVPKDDMGGPQYQGLNYGGSVIAYNPANNSLFVVGHTSNQQVAEISIPSPVNSTVLNSLNTANAIQNLVDITEGNRTHIKSGGAAETENMVLIGGLVVSGGQLVGSVYNNYDGAQTALLSHFLSSTTLATTGDFSGMFEVGVKPNPVPQAGFVAGYMATIPSSWQTALGGKVLTGQSALSVLGRTSSGPSAFAFDPANLGATPATAHALVNYPLDHQTIGTYETSHTLYNNGSHHSGMVFPDGTKTIMYTGRQGMGAACYGYGNTTGQAGGAARTTNVLNAEIIAYMDSHNTDTYPCGDSSIPRSYVSGNAHACCYDPITSDTGAHAYPYADYVWMYDAADFARVNAGGRIVDNPSANLVDGLSSTSTETYKPWHIKPYSAFEWQFPTTKTGKYIFNMASAYDSTNQRLYLVQPMTDGDYPLIHVYAVNVGSSSPVSGLCGSSNGLSLSSAPTAELCAAGTPSAVTGTSPWSWTCIGSGGGNTASCSASLLNNVTSSIVPLKLGERGSIVVGPGGSLKTN